MFLEPWHCLCLSLFLYGCIVSFPWLPISNFSQSKSSMKADLVLGGGIWRRWVCIPCKGSSLSEKYRGSKMTFLTSSITHQPQPLWISTHHHLLVHIFITFLRIQNSALPNPFLFLLLFSNTLSLVLKVNAF